MKHLLYIALIPGLFIFTACQKEELSREEKWENLIHKTVDDKNVFGSVIRIEGKDFSWQYAAGNFEEESQYFIASTSKLYTTAIIFQLADEGKLSLDDPIAKYLDASVMKGLHIHKGTDYSDQITITHLLSQTSGLPDYFEGKDSDGNILRKELTAGNDREWSFEELIALSKDMKPEFAPGTAGKALYSDTNYQLLGKIIETLTQLSMAEAYEERIFKPLGLQKTYLYSDAGDEAPIDIYFKKEPLKIPLAMSSFKADGGIVSTAEESMIFIKAFMQGGLFSKEHLDQNNWNKIFYPLEYGVGMMRYKMPDFYRVPWFIGHSGLSGAFAWYSPEKDAFITGTVNQINKPGTSFRLILKMMNEL